MMYMAVSFVDRQIATLTSVHQSIPFQWDFRLVVGSVSGMLGDSRSEVQYGTHRLRHLNRRLCLCLVWSDFLAVRLTAPGVVGVVTPTKVPTCMSAPKLLK